MFEPARASVVVRFEDHRGSLAALTSLLATVDTRDEVVVVHDGDDPEVYRLLAVQSRRVRAVVADSSATLGTAWSLGAAAAQGGVVCLTSLAADAAIHTPGPLTPAALEAASGSGVVASGTTTVPVLALRTDVIGLLDACSEATSPVAALDAVEEALRNAGRELPRLNAAVKAPEAATATGRSTMDVSVLLWCAMTGETDADRVRAEIADTVVRLAALGERHPGVELGLVLVCPDPTVVEPLLPALEGDVQVVDVAGCDVDTAWSKAAARAGAAHTWQVWTGQVLDDKLLTGLPAAGASAAPELSGPTEVVTVVLLTDDDAGELGGCLLALADSGEPEGATTEFVVVDDASTDGTRELLQGLEGEVTVVLNHRTIGPRACLRRALACAEGTTVAVLPLAARVAPGWVDRLRAQIEAVQVEGVPGPEADVIWLLDDDGTVQDCLPSEAAATLS